MNSSRSARKPQTKLWAISGPSGDCICRIGGMQNSEVGPWDMSAIWDSKSKAARALRAFRKAGHKNVKMIPVRIVDYER